MEREWEVLLDGEVYSDRFDSEDLAEAHVEENNLYDLGVVEIREMSERDILKYNNGY